MPDALELGPEKFIDEQVDNVLYGLCARPDTGPFAPTLSSPPPSSSAA